MERLKLQLFMAEKLRGTCLHHEATHAEMCFYVSSSVRFRITVRIVTGRRFLRSSAGGAGPGGRSLHGRLGAG